MHQETTSPTNAAARAATVIQGIVTSELSDSSKARYGFDALVRRLWPRKRDGIRKYGLSGGGSVDLRESSTDWNVFKEIFIERIYDGHAAAVFHKTIPFRTPLILIDLGANIGLSAIALARALRPSRIVAVEPDAGNFSMLNENLRLAGLTNRSVALHAFAGAEPGYADIHDPGYGAWGMRMGPPRRSGTPVFSVADIVARAGISGYVVLKCDIEGSERQLFETMRAWEHLANFIILELHTEFLPAAALYAHLDASCFEWRIHGEIPPGAILAVLSIERVRKKPVREKPEAIGQTAG